MLQSEDNPSSGGTIETCDTRWKSSVAKKNKTKFSDWSWLDTTGIGAIN